MEEIYYEDGLYNVTSIKEVKEQLGSSVSTLDMWFPHVSKNLIIRWGQKEFRIYADSLISTTRKNRQGFPIEIIQELDIIVNVHNELYPQYKSIERIFI
jgi:hypothetical protein